MQKSKNHDYIQAIVNSNIFLEAVKQEESYYKLTWLKTTEPTDRAITFCMNELIKLKILKKKNENI